MSVHLRRTTLLLLGLALLALPAAHATTVLQMGLGDLCANSGKIFRGTVRSITPGTVTVGGGELPTVTYTFEVSDDLLGNLTTVKDGVRVTEITMLGEVKAPAANGALQSLSVLPELPRLELGSEYLLLATAPSAVGLSTTVGLGQGSFAIYADDDKVEMAVNALGNQGLYAGPVTYTQLADEIRAQIAQ